MGWFLKDKNATSCWLKPKIVKLLHFIILNILTSSVLLSCCSIYSRTIEGEKSTIKRSMSTDADFVCLLSAASVISRAWRTPNVFKVLKNDSLKEWAIMIYQNYRFQNELSMIDLLAILT